MLYNSSKPLVPSRVHNRKLANTAFKLTTMSSTHEQEGNKHKKLRTACDICHQAKMKCSGGTPCNGCRDSGYDCFYSVSNRIGRPKGTKNKRTLERMNRNQKDNPVSDDVSDASRYASGPCQDFSAPTSPIGFDFNMSTSPSVMPTSIESASIDAILGSASTTVPGYSDYNAFDSWADDVNLWADPSNFGGVPLLEVSCRCDPTLMFICSDGIK